MNQSELAIIGLYERLLPMHKKDIDYVFADVDNRKLYFSNKNTMQMYSSVNGYWILDLHGASKSSKLITMSELYTRYDEYCKNNHPYKVGDKVTLNCAVRTGVYEISDLLLSSGHFRLVRLHDKKLRTFVNLWRIKCHATTEEIQKELSKPRN